ncbi:MAG TPA: GMC family oxidoreductase N-terminal domain-containing protein [Pseudonocardia sp.]|uniref:GMC family oxidoreductase N-terminal domain-containing protein n=1 Tax=Pseudonocardia sp. TaxID=60912 RepID=UPI002C13568F|nr:GMC family oxidoreductase N-terminal domain-containing protein [Pseudonocardia sp.]HTF49397.1 GMC family oxidoreductase N-terminal domain-containing protein [Pseudonocardia sp.]
MSNHRDTLVERVLLDGRHAVGVRTADGTEHLAPEVLVCAGAIHPPALLLRSGITDRPVGENLTEHPMQTRYRRHRLRRPCTGRGRSARADQGRWPVCAN